MAFFGWISTFRIPDQKWGHVQGSLFIFLGKGLKSVIAPEEDSPRSPFILDTIYFGYKQNTDRKGQIFRMYTVDWKGPSVRGEHSLVWLCVPALCSWHRPVFYCHYSFLHKWDHATMCSTIAFLVLSSLSLAFFPQLDMHIDWLHSFLFYLFNFYLHLFLYWVVTHSCGW